VGGGDGQEDLNQKVERARISSSSPLTSFSSRLSSTLTGSDPCISARSSSASSAGARRRAEPLCAEAFPSSPPSAISDLSQISPPRSSSERSERRACCSFRPVSASLRFTERCVSNPVETGERERRGWSGGVAGLFKSAPGFGTDYITTR
jgi:hypothetical protein